MKTELKKLSQLFASSLLRGAAYAIIGFSSLAFSQDADAFQLNPRDPGNVNAITSPGNSPEQNRANIHAELARYSGGLDGATQTAIIQTSIDAAFDSARTLSRAQDRNPAQDFRRLLRNIRAISNLRIGGESVFGGVGSGFLSFEADVQRVANGFTRFGSIFNDVYNSSIQFQNERIAAGRRSSNSSAPWDDQTKPIVDLTRQHLSVGILSDVERLGAINNSTYLGFLSKDAGGGAVLYVPNGQGGVKIITDPAVQDQVFSLQLNTFCATLTDIETPPSVIFQGLFNTANVINRNPGHHPACNSIGN